MTDLFTIDDLRRLEQAVYLAPGANDDLLYKIRRVIENEWRIGKSRNPRMALTPAQLVKQMILDSPLAHVPKQVPIDVVTASFQKAYLDKLLAAVEAL
jgi:hypothetical protein